MSEKNDKTQEQDKQLPAKMERVDYLELRAGGLQVENLRLQVAMVQQQLMQAEAQQAMRAAMLAEKYGLNPTDSIAEDGTITRK